nr:uncharacterized protein LOC104087110 [Nicotiana tomentosiformis]
MSPSSASTESAINTTHPGSSSTFLTSPLFSTKKVNLQLNEDNYLLWKQQVSLTTRSHNLHYLLDDSIAAPSATIVEEGKEIPNPESLTPWATRYRPYILATRLSQSKSPSFPCCMLKGQRKGNKSMHEYLTGIKSVCDSLASCGERVSDSIHLATILAGLTPEYEPVIDVITASQYLFTIQQMNSVLLDAEAR